MSNNKEVLINNGGLKIDFPLAEPEDFSGKGSKRGNMHLHT